MDEKKFFGILLTDQQHKESLSKEEKEKYLILKELDQKYKDKTFKEITEYLMKDKETFTAEQKMVADITKSYLQQNIPPNVCYFIAYKQNSDDFVAMEGADGKNELGIDDIVRQYIDTRKTSSGEEYDCIDMLACFKAGEGYGIDIDY